MAICILFGVLLSSLALSLPVSSSSGYMTALTKGSDLTIGDVLVSTPKRIFEAGFFSVGENAYCFSIWYSEQWDPKQTVVWMANRDQPVNGRRTKLSLQKSGKLVLIDAGQLIVWTTSTTSSSHLQLMLHDNGNLVLSTSESENLWQSFQSPTNTLLPQQLLIESTSLISFRSLTNYSSGFYKLYFDSDNVIRLLYKGPEMTSVFWPDPWLKSWEGGRSTYNSSKVAVLDSSGRFQSSDELKFNASDYGITIQRRLTLDVDGNLRVYSLDKQRKSWKVSWQAKDAACQIHGICGDNSMCIYSLKTSSRKCSCLPGYKMKNLTDWSYGCKPDFGPLCSGDSTSDFLQIPNAEFYGFDIGFFSNYTLQRCKSLCLNYCDCKGFQFKFDVQNGYYNCYPKTNMFNGYHSLGFEDAVYIRLPKDKISTFEKSFQDFSLKCNSSYVTHMNRTYARENQYESLFIFLIWSTCALGAFEIICLLAYLCKTRRHSNASVEGYLQVATGFQKFSYSELKKASNNFSHEIGRGGGGIVYKGILSDNRIAAIKSLEKANQGEAEFLAEVSIIGRLNHMNLIETWGYCAEGNHRLLVYEYMENGSLAKNLQGNILNWKKRYEIALGTAKGLAYLHEECLEWVLHCDVKPENILLNNSYQPKVADFGLSKLLNRGGIENSNFSRIRGTRGYMAPEWVFNLPITSKIDVYSYGIVVLEMVTGRSPTGGHINSDSGGMEPSGSLVTWVRENWHHGKSLQIQHLIDPAMKGEFDAEKMAALVEVALRCAEEDKDARPTMSQVVDMLQHHDTED